jgi:hypothetical protein
MPQRLRLQSGKAASTLFVQNRGHLSVMLNRLESVLGPAVLADIEHAPRGVSLVLGPTGVPVSEVVSGEEKILYCDIDLQECVELKQFHDVVGYYNRFDIFRLEVDRSRRRPVNFLAGSDAASDTNSKAGKQAGKGEGSDDRLSLLDA